MALRQYLVLFQTFVLLKILQVGYMQLNNNFILFKNTYQWCSFMINGVKPGLVALLATEIVYKYIFPDPVYSNFKIFDKVII